MAVKQSLQMAAGGGRVAEVVNVNDVLDGHLVLDLQCLDRVYLNGYVPKLQVGGQVITFLTEHLGNPMTMSRENRLWGTERTRGELLTLGIVVSNGSIGATAGVSQRARRVRRGARSSPTRQPTQHESQAASVAR